MSIAEPPDAWRLVAEPMQSPLAVLPWDAADTMAEGATTCWEVDAISVGHGDPPCGC